MWTNPGILPKGYKELNYDKLTVKFAKIIDERESIHIGPKVRQLMRQGEVEKAQEMMRQVSERGSIVTKLRNEAMKEGSSQRE